MRTEKADPIVSVVMGVYNQSDRDALRQAVRSILEQTLSNLEFIIYDDGSNDDTMRSVLEEYRQQDDRICLLGEKENHGLAFSLNACIDHAKGKYIARMDADDISEPDRLETQIAFLEAHPEVDWCGCSARLFDEKGIWGRRDMPERPQKKDFLRFSPYIHPTVVYRRELLDKESGYCETDDMLRCEDYEIFMRLTEKGYCGVNLSEVLLRYRENADSYYRRTLHTRWNEAKLRWRNFREMGLLFPGGWLYVLRPLAGWCIPVPLLRWIKQREGQADAARRDHTG